MNGQAASSASPSGSGPGRGAVPVTEAVLRGMDNSAIDALFRASPAGPVPDGDLRGTVVAWPGTAAAEPLARLCYAVAWQGKVVDRRAGLLRNKISPFGVRTIKAAVSLDRSWVDGGECVLLDYSRTSLVARMVRDEIRVVAPRLYLGVVWLWHRRVGWFTLREPSPAGTSRTSRTGR